MKNGVEELCVADGNSAENALDHNPASCAAVVELSSSDWVYVTRNSGDDIACATCADFSGFLIRAH